MAVERKTRDARSRHWGNSQETCVEAGLALENRRELVAGDTGVLALRRHGPQTFRPIRTTTRSRRCGSGATCLWGVRVAGVYGIGVAVRAAALPGDVAPAADVRCRREADVRDRRRGRLSWGEERTFMHLIGDYPALNFRQVTGCARQNEPEFVIGFRAHRAHHTI